MGMSEFYGPSDEMESMATIHRALSLGVTLLDTADMYGVGKNEELVGRAIRGCRDRVILATKFGNVRGASGEFLDVNGRAEYVKRACEARSLDCVDEVAQFQPVPADQLFKKRSKSG